MDILGIGGAIKKVGMVVGLKKAYDTLMKHIHDPNRKVRVVMPDNATVEVKPSYASGINWAAVGMFAASVVKMFGASPPTDLAGWIEAAGLGLTSIFIFVKRTWFTTKLTPQSAKKI